MFLKENSTDANVQTTRLHLGEKNKRANNKAGPKQNPEERPV